LSSSKPAELNFCKYPISALLDESVTMAKDRLTLKQIKLKEIIAIACPNYLLIRKSKNGIAQHYH